MSVQFILGRAGTGKTQWIINSLAEQSVALPLGPPIYWLVPNQATFISQRRLMEHLPAAARIQVVGPHRFCESILEYIGCAAPQTVTPAVRLLLLGRVLERVRGKLLHFRAGVPLPGFLRAVDGTLQQLVREKQTGEGLRKAAELIRDGGQTILSQKLHDLALLLDAWNDAISTHRFDPDQLPAHVQTLAGEHRYELEKISIYVDAFSSMSASEMDLISTLGCCVQRMVIGVLIDPAIINNGAAPPSGVFCRTADFYYRLVSKLKSVGAVMEPPVCMHSAQRFTSPGLTQLEAALCDGAPSHINPAVTPAPRGSHTPPARASPLDIVMHLASDPAAEVAFIATEIRRLVQQGCRYRQIGVITNAMDTYEHLFERVFANYHIPVFIDRHKPVALHPMTVAARALLRLGNGNPDFSDLMRLLRSGITACHEKDIDDFENFAFAFAMTRRPLNQPFDAQSSPAQPVGRKSHLEHLQAAANRVRVVLDEMLSPWMVACRAGIQPGEFWTAAFRAVLFSSVARQQLSAMADAALSDGDPQRAELHQAMAGQMEDLFNAMHAELSGSPMDYPAFNNLASTLLDGLTLRVIPPTVDQVLVTSAQRSRHPEFKVVFIAGFRDGLFPLLADENSLLSSQDRQLTQNYLPGIFTPSREQILAAPFFDYVAMTRASDRLILSRPLLDLAGSRTTPSVYEQRFAAEMLRTTGNRHPTCLADLTSPHDALIYAARKLGCQPDADVSSGGGLIDWLDRDAPADLRQRWATLAARLRPPPLQAVDARSLLRRANGKLTLSLTALETYALCPLQHYFKFMLRLSPRPRWQADRQEIGSTIHSRLEEIFNNIIQQSGELADWPCVNIGQINKAVQKAFAASSVAQAAEMDSMELRPLLHLIVSDITIMLAYQAQLAQVLHLHPHKVEHRFAVPIAQLSNGQCPPHLAAVELEGKIDRVDVLPTGDSTGMGAVIFDYKSSETKIENNKRAAGVQLQLVGYLLVANYLSHQSLPGAGAFYQPLRPQAASPSDRQDGEEDRPQPSNIMARGMLSWNRQDAPAELEPLLGKTINKNGSLYKSGALKPPDYIEQIKDETRTAVMHLAGQILSGNIQPSPLQLGTSHTACDQCEFKTCCPFDRIGGSYRTMRQLADSAPQEVTP